MNKADYLKIKQKIAQNKPLTATVVTMGVQYSVFFFGLYLLARGGAVNFILSQIILALFFFHSFGMLHEAGHGNLHKIRWVNSLLGHLYSITCFMPYYAWKHMHQGHHIWTGSINKDPGSRTLLKLRKLGKVPFLYDLAWRIWLPLPAIAQHIRLWFYPYHLWRENPNNRHLIYQSTFSTMVLILSYSILHYNFPHLITLNNFALSIYLYFVLTEIINVPHHVSMPHFYSTPERDKLHPWEQYISTRSCRYPGILSEIIALNFNLHTEHHFYPNVPWYRLKKVRDILKPRLGNEYTEVSDFGWNIANRRKSAADVILPDVPHPLLNPAT